MTRQHVRRSSDTTRQARNGDGLFLAPSTVDGAGVFCHKHITAGAAVIECGGLIVRPNDVKWHLAAMQIGPDTYLAEDPDDPRTDDFLNHSCEPNLGFVSGSLMLYALRNIGAGEELFFDYSTTMNEPGWAFRCRCRTGSCRGRVQSYCDLSEPQQKRLRNLVLAYLRETRSD